MSRSYKKTPVYKEGYGSKKLKFWKRLSNKRIRHTKDVPNNREFKKILEAWQIHDYRFYYPESEVDKDSTFYTKIDWKKDYKYK